MVWTPKRDGDGNIIQVRPDMAIMRLKQTIGASRGVVLDDESRRYMADLSAVMGGMDHLEAEQAIEGEAEEVANEQA